MLISKAIFIWLPLKPVFWLQNIGGTQSYVTIPEGDEKSKILTSVSFFFTHTVSFLVFCLFGLFWPGRGPTDKRLLHLDFVSQPCNPQHAFRCPPSVCHLLGFPKPTHGKRGGRGGGWQFPSVADWKLLPQSVWPSCSIEGLLEEDQPVSSTGVCFLVPTPPCESPGPGRPPSVMGVIPLQTIQESLPSGRGRV